MISSIIVAVSENGVIGLNNKLPWHLPIDLAWFKNTTLNQAIIMGMRSYQSLGKALPNRKNIVLSRKIKELPDALVYPNLEAALYAVKNEPEVFITGGGIVYREALEKNLVNKMYITEIHHHFEGDTFFPKVNFEEWELINSIHHPADLKNNYPCTINTYIKKRAFT